MASVMAKCPAGHAWMAQQVIKTERPHGKAFIAQRIVSPAVCPQCGRRWSTVEEVRS